MKPQPTLRVERLLYYHRVKVAALWDSVVTSRGGTPETELAGCINYSLYQPIEEREPVYKKFQPKEGSSW
ncbi:MAG: hypothetical protein AB1589_19350 [Cyanobacteriota bacterium]